MVKRLVVAVLAAVLLAGCGSNPQKGAEKDRDMPQPADKDK